MACHAPDRAGGHSYARDHDAALHGQRDRQRQTVRHAVSRDGYMRASAKELCERGGGCPGPPSLKVRTVSATRKKECNAGIFRELCESRGRRPGLPVPNCLYGFCGRKATVNSTFRAQELCESRGGRPGLPTLAVRTVSVDVKQH